MEKQKGLAIITGASQGIGAVIAAGLAKDGYRVVLIARNRQNLEKVHDEIMLSDKNVQEPIVLPLDITDCTKVDTEIKNIHQKYGTVDILVNAAAMFMDGSLSESVDNFRKIIEINVIAQYGILKTVTEIMKVQKNGYILCPYRNKLQGYMADTDVRRISGLERHGEIRKGTGIAIL